MTFRQYRFAMCCNLFFVTIVLASLWSETMLAQSDTTPPFVVVAYFRGNGADAENYRLDELTHINYSFLRMRGSRLVLRGVRDSANIASLVAVKQKHPNLKIDISFGGWGGCETCSDVFATKEGREEFAESVREILQRFGADGIDLDWEYPAVEGFPGHKFSPADRENFTKLVRELRGALGEKYEITFAAGGTTECLRNSIDWAGVMPLVDRVHVMTYDLVNGFSTMTGHHTPLYSSADQEESADRAVRLLDSLGVPLNKIVIGGAFYGRVFESVDSARHGLFQKGSFKTYLLNRNFDDFFSRYRGFVHYWDSSASAAYSYSPENRLFITYDSQRSLSLKTTYAVGRGLGGIMFWELTGDKRGNGLLEAIHKTLRQESQR